MKPLLLFVCLLSAFFSFGQHEDRYAEDVQSIDAIIEALYGSISGEKGQERDWDRFRNLFIPEARLIPSGVWEGKFSYRIMTPEDYIQSSGKWLVENGFFETEIHRVQEVYGSLAHVWTTYESRRSASDEKPFMRGINSIQLMHDGQRWWIVQVYWLGETAENPLPKEYLGNQ
ncbi:MAG: hypothetical protein CMN32_08520 [Saprospirales bacterium]|nr:hypothetical protein [Saprospirales bacterium]